MTTARIFSILLFSFTLACQKELASFKDGSVTRDELRIIMEATGHSQTDATIEIQDRTIQNIAFIRLAAREYAKPAGNAALNEAEALLATVSVLLKRQASDATFSMADYQFVFLGKHPAHEHRPGDDHKHETPPMDRMAEARTLADRLNDASLSDQDIEDIIYEKNEKQRYRFLGGYLDPHCISCKPNQLDFLSEPLASAEKRKFQVIDSLDGYWIARQLEVRELDADELAGAFEDYHRKVTRIALRHISKLPEAQQKQMREGLMNQEMIENLSSRQAQAQIQRGTQAGIQEALEELRNKHKFQPREIDVNKLKDTTELYELEGKVFTYGDLKPLLPEDSTHPGEHMQIMQSVLVPARLIKLDSRFKDADKTPEYRFLLELKGMESQARRYFGAKMADFKVTEDDISEYYALKKGSDFSGKSLAQSRAEIENTLNQSRSADSMKKIRDELAAKYELRIHRDRLKAGKL
ncbi:MAG: hypothetical protein HS115_04930 [Spirochaetales bacterium]|nr:hypothetical protein [Spirochaetales bacterium]